LSGALLCGTAPFHRAFRDFLLHDSILERIVG